MGAVAASVPIILHFFYKARYRPQPWAAMRFLKLSLEQTSRRLRFQELLLLFLRILVLILLAIALARPTQRLISQGMATSESVDEILILDVSGSMQAREGTKTRFEMEKEAAIKLIDALPAGSTVRVITCGERAKFIGPISPSNLDQAKELIKRIEPTGQATDFAVGLKEAQSLLRQIYGNNKEVILLSDMQRLGFEHQSEQVKQLSTQISQEGNLYFLKVGEKPISNAAIVDIVPQFGIPHAGARIPFQITVRNTGYAAIPKMSLRLEVDGKAAEGEERTIESLAPGEMRPVTASVKFDKPGWKAVTAKILSDDLDIDNRLDRVIKVRERLRVLIVDGSPNDREPEKSASYYLGHALSAAGQEGTKGALQIRIVKPEEASPRILDLFDVCILSNVSASGVLYSNGFLPALKPFLNEGKGLIIGVGDKVEPSAYTSTFGPGQGLDLLPGKFTEIDQTPMKDNKPEPFRFAPASFEQNSFVGIFQKPPFDQIGNALIRKRVHIDPASVQGQVLARYSDDVPAIVARTIGAGEILWITTSLDSSWSTWAPGRPPEEMTFLPFMIKALTHLANRGVNPFNRTCGEPLEFFTDEQIRTYDLLRPDNKRERLGNALEPNVDRKGAKPKIVYTDTDLPGTYTIYGPNNRVEAVFAVAYDPRETDNLEPMKLDEIEKLLGFTPKFVNVDGKIADRINATRSESEWTIPLLVALLFLAFGEFLLAWFCGRSW